MTPEIHCGFVAIIGRPNVGKSTLLNSLLEQKISIISRKPQTTRHRILGIKTKDNQQIVYVDTPGIHLHQTKAMNRYLNKTALHSLRDVDVVLFVVDALLWTEEDAWILDKLTHLTVPVIAVVNKVDKVKDKEKLLPYLSMIAEKFPFTQIVPISARTQKGAQRIEQVLTPYLPVSDTFLFPQEMITDKSARFMMAELIREKLLDSLGQEVPHAITIEIEEWDETKADLLRIGAIIWVESQGQKPIVIGAGGARLKDVGRAARLDAEALFHKKIFLRLWVKVRGAWSDDERALRSLGFNDE